MSTNRIYTLSFIVASVLASTGLLAQKRCNVDERLSEVWNSEPMDRVNELLLNGRDQVGVRSVVTIPVVIHIVSRAEEPYVSDRQVSSQLDVMNRDFAFMSENAPFTPGEFYSLGSDAEIRFCLASLDPDGAPTNGITRTVTQVNNIGTHRQPGGRYSIHYTQFGGADGWDPDRYINIWVGSMEGLLGSATIPGMAAFPQEDGVVIDPDYFGGIGTGAASYPFDRGHTLTHEMGHYLGLFHIWGPGSGNCSDDDLVEDTPVQEGAYLGCPEFPQFSCGSSDMFMNFMDFTSDRCLALFTSGQIARMQATLISVRSGLLDNSEGCAPHNGGKPDVDNALLYFDPTGNQIVIEVEGDLELTKYGEVYSMDGKLVLSFSWVIGSTFWVDADGFASGVYVVRLRSGDMSESKQVVVSK